jgi:ATPase family associated with various cellular activities (AAA)
LQAAAQPPPPILTNSEDADEPSRKRRKSSSSDIPHSTSEAVPSLLPSKAIQSLAPKSLHPFFMLRTASVESAVSTTSMPLLPLPQGKTVYLGTGKVAPFPPRGMNHIYTDTPNPPVIPHSLPLKQKKGKTSYRNYQGSYTNLIKHTTSIDFIPPEKLVIPKSDIVKDAQKLATPKSHWSFLRAFQILCEEDRMKDPDGEPWTYKFRPRTAEEILCSQDQGIELRDWMGGKRKIIDPSLKEMNDFIVNDEDSDISESESEIDDDDDDESPKKKRRRRKKFMSYSNVVILTGPHGVGKSAAVDAVAQQLGYQVFEISPGSRRGGKEVMEAVGEVGQSELVTRHKSITVAPLVGVNGITSTSITAHGRKGLICLDEVDILYEEDRGFWTSVTGLVEKSRRPVIMTCNGEEFKS